jgi:uncharacterized protein (DUF58 family)
MNSAALALPDAERLLLRLEWRVLRRLDGALHGDYRGLLLGAGDDLADLREYQAHDDVRHIDWNVTARLQTPYVREYHEDRDLTAWFLVDLSPSSDVGARTSRGAVALDFVALMARLLTRRGNRVGALRYRRRVDAVVPAGNGRRHVLQLIHTLSQPAPQPAKTAKVSAVGGTRLHELLNAAHPLLKRRAQVFVISDFLCEAGWEQPLARLAQRHEVLAVRLTDPLDAQVPDLGLVLMGDAESGEQIIVDTHDRGFRARHARAVERREAQLREALGNAGVDAFELSTEDDLAQSLIHFVQLRRRVSQRRGGAAGVGVVA